MSKLSDAGKGFQPPPGYDIGGDVQPAHHPSPVLPITTQGEDGASEFQPPTGQIPEKDLPVGDSLAGMTENVLGDATREDLASDVGCIAMPDTPSVASLNPSLVDADAPPLKGGFLGRQNGWDR